MNVHNCLNCFRHRKVLLGLSFLVVAVLVPSVGLYLQQMLSCEQALMVLRHGLLKHSTIHGEGGFTVPDRNATIANQFGRAENSSHYYKSNDIDSDVHASRDFTPVPDVNAAITLQSGHVDHDFRSGLPKHRYDYVANDVAKFAVNTTSDVNATYTLPLVLVVIVGSHRGGIETHSRFLNLFLRPQCADLATFKTNQVDSADLLRMSSKYIWNMTEYEYDSSGILWGDYYASKACSNCTRWRANLNASTQDYGSRQTWMSGLINLAYRHEALLKIYELELTSQYDFFIFTRSDAYFLCMPPFEEMFKYPRHVSLPDLNGWFGGYTDRLIVCPVKILKHCASPLYRPLLDPTYTGPGGTTWGSKANPERIWRQRLFEEGLQVHEFKGTFFMVREPAETYRWSPGKYDENIGLYIKYPNGEYYHQNNTFDYVQKRCNSIEANESLLCHVSTERGLKASFAAFAAISMNNADTLYRAMRQIEALGGVFKDYVVVIVENDSKDETRSILLNWMNRNARVVVDSANFGKRKKASIAWLAHLRNRALEIVYNKVYGGASDQPWKTDFVVVLDLDLVAIDLQGFKKAASAVLGNSLAHPMVGATANGVHRDGRYYDTYAYRSCRWRWNASNGIMYAKVLPSQWDDLMPLYPSDLPPFPVSSAFSGVAIYNARDVFGPIPTEGFPSWRGYESAIAAGKSKNSRVGTVFEDLEEIGKEDLLPCAYGDGGVRECEHISFHACLNARAAARLKTSLHLFPNFGVQYSFGRASQLKDWPSSYVLPGNNPDFDELSVKLPEGYVGQPPFWKKSSEMKCRR